MQNLNSTEFPPAQVMALYCGSALSFNLPNGATFADLADRLSEPGNRHTGSPTAIMLKFDLPRPPAFTRRIEA